MSKQLRQLRQLARLYGIQTSYIDVRKEKQEADPESLLLVLRAMGAEVATFDDVPEALRQRLQARANRTSEPVLVAWDGALKEVPNGEVILEDGSKHDSKASLPPGYHQLRSGSDESLIISAPVKAYSPFSSREWGLFAPIYALHSKRTPYAGDLTDFEHVVDWMGALGGRVAATLPLLATFLDEPFEPSPYSPASRLFWNEFYADVTRIPEFASNPKVRELAGGRARQTRLVDYRGQMAAKRSILEELARTFFSKASTQRRGAFEEFVRNQDGMEDYARFRAVTDRRNSGWTSWPARLRAGDILAGDYSEAARRYHLYSQWIVQEQLGALSNKAKSAGQALYLDLPLGLHPDSYDIWHERDLFLKGVAGGAPPDVIFTTGQNWGFPPMHPEAVRLSRHRYTIAYIRNHLRYARLLRIDHVMGLHRLYCIPDGQSGDKGLYVEYPSEELYAILNLESHRNQAGIVGENLGIVPPNVNAAMSRRNIQRMYVVQYEMFGDISKGVLKTPPQNSVASLNTHDMPPFRAFWESLDIDDRLDLKFLDEKAARQERRQRARMKKVLIHFLRKKGFLKLATRTKPEDVFRALLQFLSSSPSNVVLVNVEDLWQEVQSQNVPATHKERPNWRRRIQPCIEEMREMPEVIEVLEHVFAQRSRPLPF